jgi:hypothetical protein
VSRRYQPAPSGTTSAGIIGDLDSRRRRQGRGERHPCGNRSEWAAYAARRSSARCCHLAAAKLAVNIVGRHRAKGAVTMLEVAPRDLSSILAQRASAEAGGTVAGEWPAVSPVGVGHVCGAPMPQSRDAVPLRETRCARQHLESSAISTWHPGCVTAAGREVRP